METKVCGKCKIEKSVDCFYKKKSAKDGHRGYCKECEKIIRDLYYKEHILNNSEVIEKRKIHNKKYRENNKEKESKRRKEWYNSPEGIAYKKKYKEENKEKIKETAKKYRENNKEVIQKRVNNWYNNKIKTDTLFHLKCSVKNSIRDSIKRNSFNKTSKTALILGCSVEEFKIYIESQFESWMNWKNYGKYNGEFNYGWDLDHIIPAASATNEEEMLKLNHYTNFQPLCSKINRDVKRDIVNFNKE